jgi:hypothetical protein
MSILSDCGCGGPQSARYPWSHFPVAELAPGRFAGDWEFACVPSLPLVHSRLSQLDARPWPRRE